MPAYRYADAHRIFNHLCRAALVPALFLLAAAAFAAEREARILVLGDSLAAGHGVAAGDAFPVRLEAGLRSRGFNVQVIDASVSGDTSAGGRARLNWALADKPDLVVLELGANDALRGLPAQATYANLDAILTRLKARNIKVLLTGMLAPPNMGRAYETAFNAVYAKLAARHDVAFYPFFLDGVAARAALNQADGIHPNASGVAVIVDRITPYVVRLLKPPG